MSRARAAVIGGSGFYALEDLADVEEVRPDTPFGPPSDTIVIGTLRGTRADARPPLRVAFLPRHGRGHRILPSDLPSRANIYALKTLGVEFVIGVSAVGSLREEIAPMHLAVPDQLIDRTAGRRGTFFGDGLAAHVPFAEPCCPVLRHALCEASTQAGATVHDGGTLVVMEGPAFSTRAESALYRAWGASLIGMTALPEAKLAREAEMCYAILACATDYDCWHDSYGSVTAEMIVRNLTQSVATARRAVTLALDRLPDHRDCPCSTALRDALVTPWHLVPESTKQTLAPIIGKYLEQPG
jgi:5'-methylthioadenosine phosphorylase